MSSTKTVRRVLRGTAVACAAFCLAAVNGCTSHLSPPPPRVEQPAPPPQPPPFPPQKVMEDGDYTAFFAENQKTLKECDGSGGEPCAAALFNLGFLHAYSKSPYHDRSRALGYFKKVVKNHPKTPWAYQSLAWIDLIEKSVSLEKKRRQLQGELKKKDASIDQLRNQMKRSRDIDEEIDRKEKELLY